MATPPLERSGWMQQLSNICSRRLCFYHLSRDTGYIILLPKYCWWWCSVGCYRYQRGRAFVESTSGISCSSWNSERTRDGHSCSTTHSSSEQMWPRRCHESLVLRPSRPIRSSVEASALSFPRLLFHSLTESQWQRQRKVCQSWALRKTEFFNNVVNSMKRQQWLRND